MATNKITNLALRKLKSSEKEQLLSDGGGLFIRDRTLPEGGAISFRYAYRTDGKLRWLTLKAATLSEARKERDTCKQLVKNGIDPGTEKILIKERKRKEQLEEQTALAKQQALITVNDLFERWFITDLKNHKDGGIEIRRKSEKDVLPIIGNMAVADVRKGHITEIIDKILARDVNRIAKMMLALIRQMFRFAVDRDIIEFDPSASLKKSKIGGKTVERERVLSEDEIKELKRKLPDANLLWSTECAIWIMLSTCCRVGELIKAEWQDLDTQKKTWTIPAKNSKNGKAHTVYLSDLALSQFNRLKTLAQSERWIYPNRQNTTFVCDKTVSKQINSRQNSVILTNRSKDNTALLLPGGNWTPHDLRRTGTTLMSSLGVLGDVIEKRLNHTEQNRMKRIYQRNEMKPEQAQVWRLLGERLELLISNHDNVVYDLIHLVSVAKSTLYWKVHGYQTKTYELVQGLRVGDGMLGRIYGSIPLPSDFLDAVAAKKELAELHIFEYPASRTIKRCPNDNVDFEKADLPNVLGITFSKPSKLEFLVDIFGNIASYITPPPPYYPDGTEVICMTELMPPINFREMSIVLMKEDLNHLRELYLSNPKDEPIFPTELSESQKMTYNKLGKVRKPQYDLVHKIITQKLGYDFMNIPIPRRSKIRLLALENQNIFTNSSFDHAWNEFSKAGLLSIENKEKFITT